MGKIDLVQLRHSYAYPKEEHPEGHIYLPVSLLAAAARILQAGGEVSSLQDENLRPAHITSSHIGINLLGAPYIPEAQEFQRRTSAETKENLRFLFGGQVISGLTEGQFCHLFGENSGNGNNDAILAEHLGIDQRALPPQEQTSLIPAYKLISDEDMRKYLSREFSLYISQGCNKQCSFCAALKKRPETYRSPEIIQQDVEYLIQRALQFGIKEFDIYMSNLDVFQNPRKLNDVAEVICELREKYSFLIRLRGLSSVDSFGEARKKSPETIEKIIRAGLHTVGFGVDGWGEDVWKHLRKFQNTPERCIGAIRSAREDFGLTPEVLMVFGHNKKDNAESLEAAYAITNEMVEKYYAIPRPHVSKIFVPGNDDWGDPYYENAVRQLLTFPKTFQSLDFTALPSALTHPDPVLRELTTQYYLKICSIAGNVTQFVHPLLPGMTDEQIKGIQRFNMGKYDI
ncbi:radical SAM protein [Candidatus Peregrinibacteria bacterium]|nr:radical SAM protein [Candidatus Peregrinibacteria bacterium]